MKKTIIIFAIAALFLSLPMVFADYFDTGASTVIPTNGTVNVSGYVKLTNGTGIGAYLINCTLNGTMNSTNTSGSGWLSVLIRAPLMPGDFNVTCITPNATYNETIPVHISNFTSANITFDGLQPPFTNGTNFIVNVSTTGNGTVDPSIRIFKSYGAYMNWTVTNISAVNNTNSSNHTIRYNISMPGDADGSYILSFEKGLAFRIFTVKSTLTIVGDILDSSNSSTTIIGRTENITLRARVYDSSGAINSSNVTGRITYPNGTSIPINFTLQNSTTGTYNFTFTDTTSPGRYEISMVSNTGRNVSTSTVFDIGTVDAKLDTVKDTFFEFGSESGFAAGGQIAFNVLVANLSNNAIFSGSASNAIDRTICTNTSTTIFPIELKNQRTSNILTFGTTNLTVGTGSFFGQTVCKINFTAPSETGIYSLKVNTTTNVSGVFYNATAVGYFQIQKYILKVAPVSTLGGGFEFLSSLRPGDNATFEIGARNLSNNGTAVPGLNITGITFKKIQSLNFLRRETDITGLSSNVTAGTASANPKVQIVLPENKTGPYQIEFQATVDGENVTGTAFYFAKYIEGFAFPAGFYGGGPGGGEGSSSGFKCNGTATFTVKTMDVKTRQAARNVVLNNIEAARSESSGQDVASYLSIASSTLSDSNGLANLTMNFSSNISYSGFYFFLVNITTDEGKADILPGGFECRNLNFFPSVSANGSASGFSGGFNIAPTAAINISVSGIQNLRFSGNTTRNGTVTITRLRNFDISKGGGSAYTPASTLTYNLSNGNVSFVLGAGNFSGLTTWPNGFNDLEIQVTDNLTGGVLTTDSRGAFFRTVAFDVFAQFDFGTYTPGQVVAKEVYVRTNLTHNGTGFTNATLGAGFTGKMGRPWEGSLVDLTVNGTRISDGWSSNADFGTERWNVTFTIPTSMRKGFNMIMITAKSNITNETATIEMPGQVNKYTVQVPDEEFFQMQNYGVLAVNVTHNQSIYTSYGINLSNISQNWGVSSKSGGVCIAVNISVQRFGMGGGQSITYSTRSASANVSAVVLDNGTAGIYDTLIINNSGNITVANANNRRFNNLTSNSNLTVLYLRNVMDCGFVSLLNSAANSTGFGSGFGGQHQAGAGNNISIPFKVAQGSSVIAGANMTVFQIIMQDTNGGSDGRGGFGFTGFLDSTQYKFTNGTTDSSGIAFLTLRNISTSGSMNLMWKLDTGSDTDVAEFFNGVQFEVKSFKAWINLLEAPFRVVNLTNITTGAGPPGGNISAWNNSTVSNAGFNVFNGTWNEATQGQLVLDSNNTKIFYFVLRNVSAGSPGSFPPAAGDATTTYTDVIADDDIDLSAGESPTQGNYTETSSNWTNNINFNGLSNMLKVMGNKTISASVIQLLIAQENRSDFKTLMPSGNSTRVDANVTIEVCAYTYDRPERPVIGANITVTTEKFSPSGPPSNINLTIWDPFTNANVTSVKTGPSGCAVFNVSHPSWSGNPVGWTAGQPNNIKAIVNSSGTAETAYGPPIMVMCPPGVRCYS